MTELFETDSNSRVYILLKHFLYDINMNSLINQWQSAVLCFFFIQEVSVFIFEKKILEKMEKKSAEQILETMRSGPTHLARLRHPRVLVVQHPLEESRYEWIVTDITLQWTLEIIIGPMITFSF